MSQLDLLTVKELAERWGKSKATIKRWAKAGKIAHAAKVPGSTGAYLFDSDVQPPAEPVTR